MLLGAGLAVLTMAGTVGAAAPARAQPGSPPGDPDWHIPLPSAGSTTEPTHADYRLIQRELARYRALAEEGGWARVPDGPPLRAGMRDPRVELLRDRLRRGGDYAAEMGADPWFFEPALDQTLRRLQRRHGIPATGVLDQDTLAAANIPADELAGRLAVVAQRWRWLPLDLGPLYAWVNIPRARLDVMANGESVLAMRVVVGHRERPTPSLYGRLSRITFNPTWSVPDLIAREDLLPRQREDPTFLSRNGIRVYGASGRELDSARLDWDRAGTAQFPYRLVQDAGPGNSLGRIRISFDNPYDIYLHDTPARGLFGLGSRWLSSGCVRLENAPALTTLLMGRDRSWTEEQTRAAIDARVTRTVRLERDVPVYLVYLTAWADDDGTLRFGPDIYGRDARLLAGGAAVAHDTR